MGKIDFSAELINGLLDLFDKRAKSGNYKGKKYITLQHEFIIGAISAVDLINKGETSCIRPIIWIRIMRGEKIEKIVL